MSREDKDLNFDFPPLKTSLIDVLWIGFDLKNKNLKSVFDLKDLEVEFTLHQMWKGDSWVYANEPRLSLQESGCEPAGNVRVKWGCQGSRSGWVPSGLGTGWAESLCFRPVGYFSCLSRFCLRERGHRLISLTWDQTTWLLLSTDLFYHTVLLKR